MKSTAIGALLVYLVVLSLASVPQFLGAIGVMLSLMMACDPVATALMNLIVLGPPVVVLAAPVLMMGMFIRAS